ncbi:RNA polymerase sigma factor SigZ [bacterium I07]|nr:RNA polymerase sigma factor SigZ [bacterium I07]
MENIEHIWTNYQAKLHSFIQSRVGDPTTADDILQDVFLTIYSKIGTLKDSRKIQSWIYQITRNKIIDYYRSHKKMDELPESLSTQDTNPEDEALEEISRCVLPMIHNLPPHYRETIMLSEIEGYKQKDVALKQGLSLPGVKKRIQRGRAMIKDMLLECCRFEFDRRGSVIDYENINSQCNDC